MAISIVLTEYESYKMTHTYNEEGNKGGNHEPLNRSKFLKGKQGSTDRRFGPNLKQKMQGSTDRRFRLNFKKRMQGSADRRFAPNFKKIAGIHGPSIWSEFLKRGCRDPRTDDLVRILKKL